MSKEEQIKKLEVQFKQVFGSMGTEEMKQQFIKANLKLEEDVPASACRIDDPDCLSCGS